MIKVRLVIILVLGDRNIKTNEDYFILYTANSKKVVLRKSKIQITKYQIQGKGSHATHKSGLLTSSPQYNLYEKVFSVNSGISPRYMFTLYLKPNTKYFDLILYIYFGI